MTVMSLVCPHNVEVVGGKVKCDVCFPPRTVGKRKVCTSKAAITVHAKDGKKGVLPGVHVECNKKAKHKGLHRGVYEGQTFHWRG